MKLSENFELDEFIKTSRPELQDIPRQEVVINLTRLCAFVLQPLRDKAGILVVSSGYRSNDLNFYVGGASNSQHKLGLAADIISSRFPLKKLVEFIRDEPSIMMHVDQCITESQNGSHWLHISIAPIGAAPRSQFLNIQK